MSDFYVTAVFVPPQAPGMSQPEVVTMALPVAKELALLLTKTLKQWERDNGQQVHIPLKMYQQMGIAPEDWGGTP